MFWQTGEWWDKKDKKKVNTHKPHNPKEHAMRVERIGKTPSGKIHGFVTFAPDERQQAVTTMARLDSIRDEQHHSRPPRARMPWTSHTLDSWDGVTIGVRSE
jgi:hypothetical protein